MNTINSIFCCTNTCDCSSYKSLWIVLSICLFSLLIVLVVCGAIETIFKNKYEEQTKQKKEEYDHEEKLRKESCQREKDLFDLERKRKGEDLERKIREFNDLTIPQKLLEKVIEKELSENIKSLNDEIGSIKAELEKAKVEISGYVLKKD